MTGPLRVAILGSGNIGTDLLMKIARSPHLVCSLFCGRRHDSRGMTIARGGGVTVSDRGIDALLDRPDCCDLVVDATSAADHARHWRALEPLGKPVIDMTPSRIGSPVIPALHAAASGQNLNMVTCGGQAAIPIAYAIAQSCPTVAYVEVMSSIASRSAGPATRRNLDEYIDATEAALRAFTGSRSAKAMLVLNPADPPVNMQTTISLQVERADMARVQASALAMAKTIQRYVPGYEVVVPPVFESNRIVTTVRVRGRGDYLPCFAGNLDIITCAAVAAAENLCQ